MASFKKGDVVRLKSGGPKMTVVNVEDYQPDDVQCMWFDGNRREVDVFDKEALKPTDNESGSTSIERG